MNQTMEYVNPISGIYILDPSGIPLFARYYHGKSKKVDSTLLGGFFSAIEVFVKTSLDEMLTDIGMTTSRYFFERVNKGYIIVLIVPTMGKKSVSPDALSAINDTLEILRNFFVILEELAGRLLLDTSAMIEQMGSTVDSFLFETSMEHLEPEIIEEMEYDVSSGEEVDSTILSEIRSKISKL